MMAERPLETFITLILEEEDAGLAQAHRELYPERIPEHIPLSLTLLYPWIPAESVKQADTEQLRAFFASRPAPDFHLTRLAEFPGKVVYAVPEPDGKLRATMRALWALYPEYRRTASPAAIHRHLARSAGWRATTPSLLSRPPLPIRRTGR